MDTANNAALKCRPPDSEAGMKNKAYCIGGSQDGVQVVSPSSHFMTPLDEIYTLCQIKITNFDGSISNKHFWRLERLSYQEATARARSLFNH